MIRINCKKTETKDINEQIYINKYMSLSTGTNHLKTCSVLWVQRVHHAFVSGVLSGMCFGFCN